MTRAIRFTTHAWSDYTYWQQQDRKTLKRLNMLIDASVREPFAGVGKTEPLVGNYSGLWSRRIDEKNRLVYVADDADLTVIACRFRYDDK